jgi:hypothetical protein
MYVITRTYETKPGQAKLAATLAAKICDAYEAAGQRDQPKVSFNGGTLPSEVNRVYMRWTAETIESPYRGGNESPDTSEFSSELREVTVRNWIEFEELLTPDKY